MNRYSFSDIFQEVPDGSLKTMSRVDVNGKIFDANYAFEPGTLVGGVNFFKYKNLDIAAEDGSDDVLVIKGFYT